MYWSKQKQKTIKSIWLASDSYIKRLAQISSSIIANYESHSHFRNTYKLQSLILTQCRSLSEVRKHFSYTDWNGCGNACNFDRLQFAYTMQFSAIYLSAKRESFENIATFWCHAININLSDIMQNSSNFRFRRDDGFSELLQICCICNILHLYFYMEGSLKYYTYIHT